MCKKSIYLQEKFLKKYKKLCFEVFLSPFPPKLGTNFLKNLAWPPIKSDKTNDRSFRKIGNRWINEQTVRQTTVRLESRDPKRKINFSFHFCFTYTCGACCKHEYILHSEQVTSLVAELTNTQTLLNKHLSPHLWSL